MGRLTLGITFLLVFTSVSFSQQITDEQVWKYALMTEVVDQMKADLSKEVNEMIRNQEGMTGQRYLELADGATPADDFEKQFMETVNQLKQRRIEAIKSVNSDLATKMLGGADVYKAVKSAVKGEMKAKYDAYRAQIGYSG